MNDTIVLEGEFGMDEVLDGEPEEVVNIVDDQVMTNEQIRAAAVAGWGAI